MGGVLSFNLCLPLASAIYFQNAKVNGRNLYPLPLVSLPPTIIWLLAIPQHQTAFCSDQITPTWQTEWVFSQPHLTGPPRIIWLWELFLSWNSPRLFWHPLGSLSSSLTTLSQEQSLVLPLGTALLMLIFFNPKLGTLCIPVWISSFTPMLLTTSYILTPWLLNL